MTPYGDIDLGHIGSGMGFFSDGNGFCARHELCV